MAASDRRGGRGRAWMTFEPQNEVACNWRGGYVSSLDLAGRLGRFASPFALGARVPTSLQTSKTAASTMDAA
ncbi:MAG TPA: hypothetical protein VE986_08280 [Hyphomicrobiales bacterium]|nr:hypothetical protein [Hyphomicrobiales bacterium]